MPLYTYKIEEFHLFFAELFYLYLICAHCYDFAFCGVMAILYFALPASMSPSSLYLNHSFTPWFCFAVFVRIVDSTFVEKRPVCQLSTPVPVQTLLSLARFGLAFLGHRCIGGRGGRRRRLWQCFDAFGWRRRRLRRRMAHALMANKRSQGRLVPTCHHHHHPRERSRWAELHP